MEKYKVVIIGSGIAGITSAIYLKRGGLSPVIIENNVPGGMLNNIPNIENYPGYNNITGPDLAVNLYNQINSLDIPIIFRNIEKVDLENKTIDDDISFDYLIIATGRKSIGLGLENEKELTSRGISYCAICDGVFYKNKSVVVVGGGSGALTDSLYLSSIAKDVTIIHRGKNFTGEKYLIDKVNKTKNIKVIFNSNIISYNTKDESLVSVTLDSKKKVKTSGVFLAIKKVPNSLLFDVEKDNDYIITDSNLMTNIKDVYAVGDVIKKNYYQLTTASYDGTVAALDIISKENLK